MLWIFTHYDAVVVAGLGAIFAILGLILRKPEGKTERESALFRETLVFQDGFTGATIGTLFLVAVIALSIENKEAIDALKRQQSTIVLFSLMGCISFVLQFRRSL